MILYFVKTSKVNGPYNAEQAKAFLQIAGGQLIAISLDLSAIGSSSLQVAAVAVPVCSPQSLP